MKRGCNARRPKNEEVSVKIPTFNAIRELRSSRLGIRVPAAECALIAMLAFSSQHALAQPSGAPAVHPSAAANVKSITTTLGSSSARKECITLSTQQRLRYWYRAEGAVNFDLQYVEGEETLHPVKKDKAAIGSGTFQPKVAQDYCLVWTNLAKHPFNLSFEFARVNN